MDNELDKTQEKETLTDEKLEDVAGGAPMAYQQSFVSEWCPYCRKQDRVQKGGSTTITIMTYKQETIPVKTYFCYANVGNGVIVSNPPRRFYVEESGSAKYYFDDHFANVKP